MDHAMALFSDASPKVRDEDVKGSMGDLGGVSAEDWTPLDCDSGKGSSLESLSQIGDEKFQGDSPFPSQRAEVALVTPATSADKTIDCVSRKRRRRSSSASNFNGGPHPVISFASDLLLQSNNAYLTESLLRIYHDSFEHALSCWVTERTCPYSAKSDALLATDARPDWNRIYYRVFRLDRLVSTIRGSKFTPKQDQAASKALNLAVFSFASQWSQSSQRSRSRYPFRNVPNKNGNGVFDTADESRVPGGNEFDRTLQIAAWHEARSALQNAAEIQSFRVVLAQIIFALTQRPVEMEGRSRHCPEPIPTNENGGADGNTKDTEDIAPTTATDEDVNDCEDLMSKLDLAIEADGPPVHLESGLRLIHSLRSRMVMSRGARRGKFGLASHTRQRRSPSIHIEGADRATIDLLFWLGVMFDTLSAAMHKRPLVVSDEDSDIVLEESVQMNQPVQKETENASDGRSGLWDDYLFARQLEHLQTAPTRWPCSFDRAAAVLCDAAPVKVLLFRKVCRIQTLLTRNARGEKVEQAIRAALDVYNLWNTLYAPFIRDCIQNHDSLPPRVQSWYVCVTGHWHLATLLLSDLMEAVDDSGLGTEEARELRNSSHLVAHMRGSNCGVLSDLARCACPREDASFSRSGDFHFAVNEGALLTEPWTAVMIRAFAKAGVLLLESDALLSSYLDQEDAFRRADDCIKALWFLGRKSDMALSAARILGEALKQRRKSAQDRVNDMSIFLESELWHGLDGPGHGAFEVCN
jgi:hypothetical protein